MGLLSTEVEIGLIGSNIKYYEDLGYEIPRYYHKNLCKWLVKKGTKIKVNVKHLKRGSNAIVDVECDYCKKNKKMEYCEYCNINHDGKYYCIDCVHTVLHTRENHPNWKPELTDEQRNYMRSYPEYKEFIKKVLARDNYTCQCCGKPCNHDANVHHLNGYNWFIEGRTDEKNAISLCDNCHINFHSAYGYGDNTKEQFEEWFGEIQHLLTIYNGDLPTARKIYCIEDDCIYDDVFHFAQEIGVNNTSQIYGVCNHRPSYNSIFGKHILWYDEYKNMTQEDLNKYLQSCLNKNSKKVVCLTTGVIYMNMGDASRDKTIIVARQGIYECCKQRIKTSGKLPDGTPLRWMYYEDYLNLSNEEKQELENKYKIKKIESEVA